MDKILGRKLVIQDVKISESPQTCTGISALSTRRVTEARIRTTFQDFYPENENEKHTIHSMPTPILRTKTGVSDQESIIKNPLIYLSENEINS